MRDIGQLTDFGRRGDGLAGELAAAMVRVLAPEQTKAHLDDRFGLLTAGDRPAVPRQHPDRRVGHC